MQSNTILNTNEITTIESILSTGNYIVNEKPVSQIGFKELVLNHGIVSSSKENKSEYVLKFEGGETLSFSKDGLNFVKVLEVDIVKIQNELSIIECCGNKIDLQYEGETFEGYIGYCPTCGELHEVDAYCMDGYCDSLDDELYKIKYFTYNY